MLVSSQTSKFPPGSGGGIGGGVIWAVSRANLATKPKHSAYYLLEEGREGVFQWLDNDLSTEVALDTEQGIYVAPVSDLTGGTGAFVRVFEAEAHGEWFGATGDENDNQTNAILCAINCFNAKLFPNLKYHDGTFVTYQGYVITRAYGNLLGLGKEITKFLVPEDAVGDFSLFTLGALGGGLNADRCTIDGFSFVNRNPNMTNASFAVKFLNADWATVQNVQNDGFPSGIKLGDELGSQLVNRPTLHNVRNELWTGKHGRGTLVLAAGDIRSSYVKSVATDLTDGVTTDATMMGIEYKPIETCDTGLWFNCQNNFPGNQVDHCMVIDVTLLNDPQSIANQRFLMCVFDHAEKAGIEYRGANPLAIMRRVWIEASRIFSSAGHAWRILDTVTCEMSDLHLHNSEMTGASDAAFNSIINIPRSTARRVYITGNGLLDNGNNNKVGVAFGIDEIVIANNMFVERVVGSPQNMQYAVDVTSILADNFVVTGNVSKGLLVAFAREPAYASYSPNRIIRNNTQQTSTESARVPMADGTLAVPGWHFLSDIDTGGRRVSANVGALIAGAIEAMQWTTTGAKVFDLTPGYDLELSGIASTAAPRFTSYNDAAGHIVIGSRGARGTRAVPAALQANDQLTQLYAEGHDGTAFRAMARIIAKAVGLLSGTNRGSRWEIETVEQNTVLGPSLVATFARGYYSAGATGGDKGIDTINVKIIYLDGGILWAKGAGTPEGVLAAPVGSIYSRSDGGAGTSFYVKQSGTGNTGWVGK